MLTLTRDELQKQFQERLRRIPPADWVQDMQEYFHRTGAYRPEDLKRLLGDPNRAVEVGPEPSLSAFSRR